MQDEAVFTKSCKEGLQILKYRKSMPDRTEFVSHNPAIEVRYTPEALFARLKDGDIPHSVDLGNNLLEIRRHNYDPLLRIDAFVKSDYPHSSRKSKEHGPLQGNFKAVMEIRTERKSLKAKDFGPFFEEAGLDLEYIEEATPDSAGTKYSYYVSKDPNTNHPVRIRLFNVNYGIYTMIINVPAFDQELNDLEEFAGDQKTFFDTIEKTVKAIYKMEDDKSMPKEPLTFRESEKNAQLAIKCSYCSSLYNGAQEFTCPHCNASDPITDEEGKIKYYN